ncbi:hypothetical protein QYF36_009744 [Acer negundo]|nr:hypothetical protein QYF36_009744 [Acer negundo]
MKIIGRFTRILIFLNRSANLSIALALFSWFGFNVSTGGTANEEEDRRLTQESFLRMRGFKGLDSGVPSSSIASSSNATFGIVSTSAPTPANSVNFSVDLAAFELDFPSNKIPNRSIREQ